MQEFDINRRSEGFRLLGTTAHSQAATMVLGPGEATGGPDNRHEHSDQWLYVLAGRGHARVGDREAELGAGQLLLIGAGETHEIRNTGDRPLETLNVYGPPAYR